MRLAACISRRQPGRPCEQCSCSRRCTRDLRTARSRIHMNPLKWLGMPLLGFLTTISIVVVNADRPRAEILAAMVFAAAPHDGGYRPGAR